MSSSGDFHDSTIPTKPDCAATECRVDRLASGQDVDMTALAVRAEYPTASNIFGGDSLDPVSAGSANPVGATSSCLATTCQDPQRRAQLQIIEDDPVLSPGCKARAKALILDEQILPGSVTKTQVTCRLCGGSYQLEKRGHSRWFHISNWSRHKERCRGVNFDSLPFGLRRKLRILDSKKKSDKMQKKSSKCGEMLERVI